VTTRVEGLSRLTRDLRAMGVEVADLKDVFGGLAREGADLASGFAPVRSGKLAASVRGNRSVNKAVVKAGSARVPYAAVINYGFAKRRIVASGFMQRADAVIGPEVGPRLEAEIGRLIRAKGLAR
jgi:hypothetical protein